MGRPYSAADDQFLRENYAKMTYADLAERLGRGKKSVQHHAANKLGLKKYKTLMVEDVPGLRRTWHPTLNLPRVAASTPVSCNDRIMWVCADSPSHPPYAAVVDNRFRGSGCPRCRGKVVMDETSLWGRYPAIASEWHPALNGSVTARDVFPGEQVYRWWACPTCGQAYQAWTNNRTAGGTGCKKCAQAGDSRREVELRHELALILGIPVEDRELPLNRWRQVDFVSHRDRLIVEYDGWLWHRGKEELQRDRDKTKDYESAGWRVVRVREAPLAAVGRLDLVVPRNESGYSLIVRVASFLDSELDVPVPGLADYVAGGLMLTTASVDEHLGESRRKPTVKCANPDCDVVFPVEPYRSESAQFHSLECYNDSKRVDFVCKHCGQVERMAKSAAAKRKYCSLACAYADR